MFTVTAELTRLIFVAINRNLADTVAYNGFPIGYILIDKVTIGNLV